MSATPPGTARLRVESATVGYDERVIAEHLSVAIPDESFTVVVGPNACGKSTLLRGLSRLLKPSAGQIVLDGGDINSYRTKEVARRVGLLPQSSIAPDGITVADLVARDLVARDPVASRSQVVLLGRERTRHRSADTTDAESAIHV
ncbi:ATP-binding cassette domain-containing protein [Streptomyces sp. NPDC058751]|uniref:ATP-binding cassette domain-containing protein n=1 Tax=Streptomyces sp. NPDC058751 TaxID=3346623 RepID=UPI003697FF5A